MYLRCDQSSGKLLRIAQNDTSQAGNQCIETRLRDCVLNTARPVTVALSQDWLNASQHKLEISLMHLRK